MMNSISFICSRIDSIMPATIGGKVASWRSYSNLFSSSVIGGSSAGVGLVGTVQPNRELSPRLYRGGDHA